jgi:hypothetical protein
MQEWVVEFGFIFSWIFKDFVKLSQYAICYKMDTYKIMHTKLRLRKVKNVQNLLRKHLYMTSLYYVYIKF